LGGQERGRGPPDIEHPVALVDEDQHDLGRGGQLGQRVGQLLA
jgi:hypothetical protein